jgi:hypothetical protein
MNHSPVIRAASISLWTLGHRRYYSPLLRVAAGFSAAGTAEPPRVGLNPGRRSAPAPAGIGAAKDATGDEERHPAFR